MTIPLSDRRVSEPQPAGGINAFAGTPDDLTVVYAADQETPGRIELFAVPIGPESDGDLVLDACDCAPGDPSVFGGPGEVPGLNLLDVTNVEWTAVGPDVGSVSYELLRGDAAGLPVGGLSETCVESGIEATQTTDPQSPPPGTAFYYLIRGENTCGSGWENMGTDSTGASRSGVVCP